MSQSVTPIDCHLMPCAIDHNGDALVTSYFAPNCRDSTEGNSKVLTASFRGRPLQGKEVHLPSGYTGVVLKQQKDSSSERNTSKIHVNNVFEKILFWNWDKTPTVNDKLVNMMDWFEISKQIHEDHEDSQVNISSKN